LAPVQQSFVMTTLAHLSDIHLAPLPPLRLRELANKRWTGYLNWRLNRRNSLAGAGLSTLIDHLHAQAPDFTCITGDLVNLGLDAEIAAALGWLKGIGPADRVCVCPGNHDAYLRSTLPRVCAAWRDYLSGETLDGAPFPFVRRIGDVAVIACSSAVATPPWVAAGRFDPAQADRLRRFLERLGAEGRFRVVLIHHPPTVEDFGYRKGLWGAERFRRVLAEAGAELVLHGHTHRSTRRTIPGPSGAIPVIGVAAAGTAQTDDAHGDPARYNLFDITGKPGAWRCTLREFGYRRGSREVEPLLEMPVV
jgi:3',5'-cyclic AMP phosphodiesterase CpdA